MLLLGGHLYMRLSSPRTCSLFQVHFPAPVCLLFMTLRFQKNNQLDLERQREVELVKLCSEHDPVAEMLFGDMSMAIRNDSVFAEFLNQTLHPY